MKPAAIAFALLLAAGGAAPLDGLGGGKAQQMSQEQRERMRQDMRDAYGKKGKAQGRQMSPEERQKLRHDIQDANKSLKR